MGSPQDFKSLQDAIQSSLVAVTRSSNQIAAEDLSFQKTSNPDVEEQLEETGSRLLSLTGSLLKSATTGSALSVPTLEDADDIDVHWSRIVDVLDTLLERADTALDEYTGLIKRNAHNSEEAASSKKPKSFEKVVRNANILKPQSRFELAPDNYSAPWKPLLTRKPHATIPLEGSLAEVDDDSQSTGYRHPYEQEIQSLEYPSTVFEIRDPIKYHPTEGTSAVYVDTFEGVLQMLEELKGAKEIAIDTEHHDWRTFSGLLSLMQISTRDKDWIVDTLQPWRHKLEILNEVFADPNIVKVLHGAYMDIIWLQRDLGLYIVGLFDTYWAANVLNYPTKSLAYLLKRFADFDADKKYQLADWRIRPIPEEMLYYARSDTHFLLYIYDMMRNELLEVSDRNTPENDHIGRVLSESKKVSLQRYERPIYDAENGDEKGGWYEMLYKKSSGTFNGEQLAVFRALHQWRDEMARSEDESIFYVLADKDLFSIARQIPPDPKALHSIVARSSPIAKRDLSSLFEVIAKAKAEGSNGPTAAQVLRSRNTSVNNAVLPLPSRPLKSGNETATKIENIVSTTSKVFGDMPISSRWESGVKTNEAAMNRRFPLPWASLIQNATLVSEDTKPKVAKAPSPLPAPAAAPPPEEEFTLKAGLKRKAPDSDDLHTPTKSVTDGSGALGEEEIGLSDSSDEANEATRKQMKKARKAEKRKKKLEKEAQKAAAKAEANEDEDEDDDDDAPLDYEAESKKRSFMKSGGKPASGSANKFDPYQKRTTLEGPKPARRMHGERKAGKSATFKK